MITRLLYMLFFVFNFSLVNGFTVDVIPENNSIINTLDPIISAQIGSFSNTSTFINWDNSLVGYWNFDIGNSTHAYDLSVNENHAIFPISGNHISYSNENSVRGTYVNSSGEFRNIEIEHRDYYNLYSKNTSYSFWVKPKFLGQPIPSFINKGNGNDIGFMIRLLGAFENINMVVGMGGSTTISLSTNSNTLSNNSWTHITLTTNDEGNFNLYINGLLNYTNIDTYTSYNPPYNAENIELLYNEYAHLDELMIFNRTLSENEVRSIYNSQANGFTFRPQDIDNLNQYNYTLYTINESGFLNISNYNFFVNYTGVGTKSLFPSQAVSSYLISLFLLLIFFKITKSGRF